MCVNMCDAAEVSESLQHSLGAFQTQTTTLDCGVIAIFDYDPQTYHKSKEEE